jgi:hypothetical protein
MTEQCRLQSRRKSDRCPTAASADVIGRGSTGNREFAAYEFGSVSARAAATSEMSALAAGLVALHRESDWLL